MTITLAVGDAVYMQVVALIGAITTPLLSALWRDDRLSDSCKREGASRRSSWSRSPSVTDTIPTSDRHIGRWLCDYCGTSYAEYVNGCPRCHLGEPGTSTSVRLVQSPPIPTAEAQRQAILNAWARVKPIALRGAVGDDKKYLYDPARYGEVMGFDMLMNELRGLPTPPTPGEPSAEATEVLALSRPCCKLGT